MTRVLGQNPGPYTLQGTNTYILGHRTASKSLILLDAGQDIPQYIPLLRQALSEYTGHVRDVILSHYHHDHTLGLKSVLPLLKDIGGPPPRIHKILRPEQRNTDLDRFIHEMLAELHGHFEPASNSAPLHELHDKQTFSIGSEAGQDTLTILATPGHTDDSASFVLRNSDTTSLFTADTVLGQGTAVFTDLRELIKSLERCIEEVKPKTDDAKAVQLFCGHGPVVEDGVAKMREYIAHRLQREQQIIQVLEKATEPLTAEQ